MKLYWQLFISFFKTGLFAVGGGLATLPFLYEIGEATGWFTRDDVLNMLAVSESTPGPIGVNMATYTGFTVSGVVGGILATLSLVLPSFLIGIIISGFLAKFRSSKLVDGTFRTIRPASVALISYAGLSVAAAVAFPGVTFAFSVTFLRALVSAFNWKALLVAAGTVVALLFRPKMHPIPLILAGALLGILLQM